MYTDGSRNVGKGGCSPSRLIIINVSSITILSRMEALVEALKLAENIILLGEGLKLYDHKELLISNNEHSQIHLKA